MSSTGLNPLAFSQPRIRLLHLSWLAFFITFMVWFAHAPMMSTIR